MYEVLLRTHLNKAAKLDEFFGLVFKTIKQDRNVNRAIAFIKRLIQMCYINEVGYIAATFLVISEILKLRSDIKYAFLEIKVNSSSNTK